MAINFMNEKIAYDTPEMRRKWQRNRRKAGKSDNLRYYDPVLITDQREKKDAAKKLRTANPPR